MLIKLRVHTTQPLVIVFAEFSDDFLFLVVWFSTYKVSIRFLPET